MSRVYLNLEAAHLTTLMEMFAEIEKSRDLLKSEKYVRALVKEGLDRALQAW